MTGHQLRQHHLRCRLQRTNLLDVIIASSRQQVVEEYPTDTPMLLNEEEPITYDPTAHLRIHERVLQREEEEKEEKKKKNNNNKKKEKHAEN